MDPEFDTGNFRQIATMNPNRLRAHMNQVFGEENQVPYTAGYVSQVGEGDF